jgi:hypothetical protein
MIVTLDEKRRLTVPVALAPATPGEAFDARFDEEEDAIVFRRVKRGRSWLDVLKACPVPMDDLPPRSREYPRKRKLSILSRKTAEAVTAPVSPSGT